MTANPNTQALSDVGVSIWLDDLSRERLNSGSLAKLIETHNVVGVTTNPTIFESALQNGEAYEQQLSELAAKGADAEQAVFEITTSDVREACDVFADVHSATDGVDGRVSIEVDPRMARDAQATIAEAKRLYEAVGRENVLIKIPATVEGIEAIAATIAEGISVNVTLIFSLERYRAVINAFMLGLEKAHAAGKDISKIHSVASFFVSRVDTEVDARLRAIGTPEAEALTGRAAVANARLAYRAFEQALDSERWRLLEAAGAPVQRPLWASTGVKDPALPDTLYVTELVAPHTVTTLPEKTLEAVADHGVITADTVTGAYADADALLDAVGAAGVSYQDVVDVLETEGLEKFEAAWDELLGSVRSGLDAHR